MGPGLSIRMTQPVIVLRFEATDEKNLESIKTIVEQKVAEI